MSKMVIGIFLIIFGIGCTVIGFTILPVIGVIAGIVLFVLGGWFIRAHLNSQCEISPNAGESDSTA